LISLAYIESKGRPSDGVLLLAVALAVVLAAATYRWIERPLKLRSGRRLTLTLVVSMVVIASIGWLAAVTDGFVSREPGSIQAVLAFADYDANDGDAGVGSCWIEAHLGYDGFAAECAPSAGEPGLLVWGDSHAARLTVGLRHVLGPDTNVGQFTRNGCVPVLDVPPSVHCRVSNGDVVAGLDAANPSTVMLFANWPAYGIDYSSGSMMGSSLTKTLESIGDAGVDRIIVIGPAPKWSPDLPTVVYEDWEQQSSPRSLATRLPPTAFAEVDQVDQDMRMTVEATGASFVSLLDTMCNEDGCLTSVPGSPESLLTWDYGHLTTDGARFVVEQLDGSL
jgi:hypothetical protein